MDEALDRIRRAYDSEAVASRYDAARFSSLRGRLYAARQRRLVARCLARFGPIARLLDLPCGTGRLLPVGARVADLVIGIDSAPAMLARAVGRAPAARTALCIGDAMRLPLRAGGVDVVLCVKFFHLLPPAATVAVLAEIARVARLGAVVALPVGYPLDGVARLRRRIMRRPPIAVRQPTLAEWTARFAAAGLSLAESYRIWPTVSDETVMRLTR